MIFFKDDVRVKLSITRTHANSLCLKRLSHSAASDCFSVLISVSAFDSVLVEQLSDVGP